MIRLALGLLLLLAATTAALIPPPAVTASPAPGVETAEPATGRPVRGAIHVHSNRSDGTGSPDEIAAAAARAGLDFVILTDHDDGTRGPDAPTYRSGVLMLDGIEANSGNGHIVALGLDKLPYPLGGPAKDVLADIKRFGGVSIIAHPDSPDPDRRWSGDDADFDGLEWLNADSEWRDESLPSLLRSVLTYWWRPVETLASLLDRPAAALERWDRVTRHRRVFGVAATDVHARIGLRGAGEPYDGRPVLRVPSYEQVFRAFSIQLPSVRLMQDPAKDAAAVVHAIRSGGVVSALDGLAGQGTLTVSAQSGRYRAGPGEVLPLDGRVTFRVSSTSVAGARVRLLRDGRAVEEWDAGREATIEQAAEPAVYRVEVVLATVGRPGVPWLLANPIYVGHTPVAPAAVEPPREPTRQVPLFVDGDGREWAIEKSARADGRIAVVKTVGGTQLNVRFALGGSMSDHPVVAAGRHVDPPSSDFDAIYLTARAARPMRVSVQFRAGQEPGAQRWAQSIYLDEMPRRLRVPFDTFLPVGHGLPFDAPRVSAMLLVVDTVNTSLGASGQFWVDDVVFGGGAPPPRAQVLTDSSK